MAKSLITDEGKTEVLRLAFQGKDAHSAFDYIALGGNGSTGAQNGEFKEIQDASYYRVHTDVEALTEKAIKISAIFDETNLNPSDGTLIKEIGIVNSSEHANEEKFFAYCEVPDIEKTDNISLKYSVIIEIE